MHIAVVTNRLIIGEGQGRVNVELARAAARNGHVVTCLAYHVDNRLLMEPNIEWVTMPNANGPFALVGNQRFGYASTRWLQVHGQDVDLVVGNGCSTWAPVDVNIVHFVHSAWRTSAVHDSRIRKDVHGAYQWLYSAVNARMERRALQRSRHIVAVSEKVRDELLEIDVPAERISVIHNGVDVDEFTPNAAGDADRGALGLPDAPSLGLFVGDIRTPRKGLDTILAALRTVPDMHLAVAGAKRDSPFPALARQHALTDRVHFLGFRKDIPALMASSDFFVFPSRYEACSLVLLEAMAAGLPIITAQTAGGAELVDPTAGIVLDDPDDTGALSDALFQLAENRAHREGLSRAARRIAENHTWDRMATDYMNLFARLNAPETSDASTRRVPASA
jgi:glycosyltransferase involved in cell wall biosynthesis